MYFFFFQAEDGIRDGTVTGVQTCALPIFRSTRCPDFWRSPCEPRRAPEVWAARRTNGRASHRGRRAGSAFPPSPDTTRDAALGHAARARRDIRRRRYERQV